MEDANKLAARGIISMLLIPFFVNILGYLIFQKISWHQVTVITLVTILILLCVIVIVPISQAPLIRRVLGFSGSGIVDFKSALTRQNETGFWKKAQKDFLYFGVTGASIQQDLGRFIQNEPGTQRNYRFLLMKPDGEAFPRQIAFQKGFDVHNLTEEHNHMIRVEMEAARQRMNAFITTMHASRAATGSLCRVQIRLYDEVTPWWAYCIDDREMALGLIITDDSKKADPAAILRKSEKTAVNLFSAFAKNFERLWESATPVSSALGRSGAGYAAINSVPPDAATTDHA